MRDVITRDRLLAAKQEIFTPCKVEPYEIIEKINDNAYRLKLLSHIHTHDVINVKHFMPYRDDTFDEEIEFEDKYSPTRGGRCNIGCGHQVL